MLAKFFGVVFLRTILIQLHKKKRRISSSCANVLHKTREIRKFLPCRLHCAEVRWRQEMYQKCDEYTYRSLLWHSSLPSPSLLLKLFNREPKQRRRRRRRQLEQQKSNRFIVAKHQLCTCINLFCTFFCRHGTSTKTFKCLISRFVKDGNTRQQLYFSFPELWYGPLIRIQLQKNCQHLTN